MKIRSASLAALGLISLSASVLGVPIPYGNVGTANNVTYTFIATSTGPVTAYFVGESAAYGSDIGLSINGAAPATFGLQNHTGAGGTTSTPYGTSFNMGNATAGDVLRFVLRVATLNYNGPLNPGEVTYSLNSDPSLNATGENHIYASLYGGDATIPAGIYIGFEDISPLSNGDRDYNDHQFVFTNIRSVSNVPEGGMTLAMLAMGIAGLGFLRRKV